ncbi:FKBP-type peptidyl-prolyl cis-trans isomerase [Tunicatimonas pelagia]|uniref:FKBP-type peptidyl-prolyl cis-trans isomerase n=1 Tax=Tunicatimonas pelagia TaxID=931531 RepID=UPI002666EEB8|nr:FKBP-type peptidyl-prolyl cis-trans isomerase [Tunicatimonas pelagia]WKN45075.1 FKBP-type peptidyl-prolyl cis-trans isomerase [Tunicatimonas pelagia]
MKKLLGWFLMGIVIGCWGCSDDSEDAGVQGEELLREQQQIIEDYLADNNINATRDGDIFYEVLTENPTGDTLARNDIIRIYYQIAVLDGQIIDERLADSGEPPVTYQFVASNIIDQNNLLFPVLDFSIANMRVGEEYEFYLPSAFAYLRYSLEGVVPPDAIVRARVQLVEIVTEAQLRAEEDQLIKNYLTDNNLTDADSLTAGVYYVQTQEGEADGAEASQGSRVAVRYTGTFLDGTEFDSNVSTNTLLPFTVGSNNLIDGFDIGVSQMRQGEKGTIVIPSRAAYRESVLAFPSEILSDLFQGDSFIPPYTTLVFDIELVSVN